MSSVKIRQSGGGNIVTIPKAIVETLGLQVGSELHLSLMNNKIVLEPVVLNTSLEELLAGSPKECFAITDEDKEWLNSPPVGKEA